MNSRSLRLREFVVGLLAGAVISLVAIVLGFFGVLAALAVTVVLGVLEPTRARLAGGLIAVGASWLVLVWNTVAACTPTADFCGSTNVLPLLGVAVVLVVAGLLLAVRVWLNGRRLSSS